MTNSILHVKSHSTSLILTLKLKKFISFILALMFMMTLSAGAFAVDYLEGSWSADKKTVIFTPKSVTSATQVTSSTTSWSNNGWYYVSGNVTTTKSIDVAGTANLILLDGANLTVSGGIHVPSGKTLNIYAQSGDSGNIGKLKATGSQGVVGIGGSIGESHSYPIGENGGTITIHGGSIDVTGGQGAAGIGGGNNAGNNTGASVYGGSGGTVNIYGGYVVTVGGPAGGIGHNAGRGIGRGGYATSGHPGEGSLSVDKGYGIYGSDSPNPTTKLSTNQNPSRYRYMTVVQLYTVSFDKNAEDAVDDDSSPMTSQTARADAVDSPLTLKANTFTRTGYSFDCWNTSSDGTGTSFDNNAQITVSTDMTATEISSDITLYAQWTPITYIMSFDINGGTGGTMEEQVISYDVSEDLNANGFEKTGYTFNSWNLSDDGTGTSFDNGETVRNLAASQDEVIMLYAQWTLNPYTVSFDINGGDGGTMTEQSFTYDESQDLTLNGFTKTGYTFTSWQDDSGDSYIDNQEVINLTPVSDDIVTLHAQWEANPYTVKFNSNNGTGSMSDQNFIYDIAQNLNDNEFTRKGYTFRGWKDNEHNITYSGGENVINLTPISGDIITLYAQWTVNQYTVSIDLDGGNF